MTFAIRLPCQMVNHLDTDTAIEALKRTGYRDTHSTDKLLQFKCGSRILYFNRKSHRFT